MKKVEKITFEMTTEEAILIRAAVAERIQEVNGEEWRVLHRFLEMCKEL